MSGCIIPSFVKQTIVHIGMPRTGSTYIQNACEANRHLLRRQGVFYPRATHEREAGPRTYRTSGHSRWWFDGIVGNKPEHVAAIRDEIAAAGEADTVLLSSEELFFALKDPVLRRVAGGLPETGVRIVVYLRRQDEWLESMYAEAVTGGYFRMTASFEEILREAAATPDGVPSAWVPGDLNYDNWLDRLRGRFGASNVAVRTFDEARRSDDLFADFLDLCGIGPLGPRVQVDGATVNATFAGRAVINIVRSCNGWAFESEESRRTFLGLYHGALAREGLCRKARLFEPEQRQAFLARFAASNARVAREFLGRPDGILFEASPPEPSPDMTAQEAERARELARQIYALLPKIPRDRPEIVSSNVLS